MLYKLKRIFRKKWGAWVKWIGSQKGAKDEVKRPKRPSARSLALGRVLEP